MQLRLVELSKRYCQHAALNSISLDIPDVQALVIIGPSGGGKTTLLRILAGLEVPDSGAVEIDGEAMVFDERQLLSHRRGIGTVFQAFNLFPHLSAEKEHRKRSGSGVLCDDPRVAVGPDVLSEIVR